MQPKTYLDDILAFHRQRCLNDDRSFAELFDLALQKTTPKDFVTAINSQSGLSIIAEIKRRSPSKGDLGLKLGPADMASLYQSAGASCISVLTDAEFFSGSSQDLMAARSSTEIPILRKDFTIDKRDICDARLMGADCVLLIVAALSDEELSEFLSIATELGMHALVETHDEREVGRALNAGANLIGVNQRDLVTFEVDQERAIRVISEIPENITRVAESGIRGLEDASSLAKAGYHAVLVGEAFVTSTDPSTLISALKGI